MNERTIPSPSLHISHIHIHIYLKGARDGSLVIWDLSRLVRRMRRQQKQQQRSSITSTEGDEDEDEDEKDEEEGELIRVQARVTGALLFFCAMQRRRCVCVSWHPRTPNTFKCLILIHVCANIYTTGLSHPPHLLAWRPDDTNDGGNNPSVLVACTPQREQEQQRPGESNETGGSEPNPRHKT